MFPKDLSGQGGGLGGEAEKPHGLGRAGAPMGARASSQPPNSCPQAPALPAGDSGTPDQNWSWALPGFRSQSSEHRNGASLCLGRTSSDVPTTDTTRASLPWCQPLVFSPGPLSPSKTELFCVLKLLGWELALPGPPAPGTWQLHPTPLPRCCVTSSGHLNISGWKLGSTTALPYRLIGEKGLINCRLLSA